MTNPISLFPIKTDSVEIEQAINLYIDAFPSCERRDVDEWLACLNDKSQKPFTLFGIRQEGAFAGIISCWELTDFIYIEHFAINKDARGNGIGSHTISALKAHYTTLPLVLEVELPTDEMSRRRISFYQRQGFYLNNCKYLQPPYRKEDNWFELKLMTTDPSYLDANMECVRKDIYEIAYNVKS